MIDSADFFKDYWDLTNSSLLLNSLSYPCSYRWLIIILHTREYKSYFSFSSVYGSVRLTGLSYNKYFKVWCLFLPDNHLLKKNKKQNRIQLINTNTNNSSKKLLSSTCQPKLVLIIKKWIFFKVWIWNGASKKKRI